MKKQLYRTAAATVLGLSLTTGVVAADGMPSYNYSHNYGYRHQMPSQKSLTKTTSTNNSSVGINNATSQQAYSGYATVSGSSKSSGNYSQWNHGYNNYPSARGTASTGAAANTNTTGATVNIKQMPAPTPAPVSYNLPKQKGYGGSASNTTVATSTNNSSVNISNQTDQYAATGNATVSGNGKGGNATTGPATNKNSSSFTVNVTQGN